ncbi:MAG: stage II sporulation protein M [Sphingobacteriaceae bacterium]|nr:stage II sporulation protein M [Cytophagaceae bacterium]
MREAVFIRQNADKWKAIEQDARPGDPNVLSERFIELTDDLAYARTFYPNAPVTQYLNGVAARLHQQIYRNRPEERGRFWRFWRSELPRLFRDSHRQLLYSFLIFAAAVLLGVVSALHDDTFVRLILGDGYVNQTLENIEKGDPLAIYKSAGQAEMFLAITFNNIRVAFFAFVLGVTFSTGTVWLLFQNGVMLGAFQTFFYQKGFLLTSLLTVWIHGTLEISAIVIAGCAGLVMGNSLLFPGTYPRLHSFRQGAKQGLKIAVGLVPIFIAAGFLESFVTRLPLPWYLSGSIIAASAAFIGWYFVWYPIQLQTKNAKP